jgi:hypothetical protein
VKKVIWMLAIWILVIALLVGLLTIILLFACWGFLALGTFAESYLERHLHHHA